MIKANVIEAARSLMSAKQRTFLALLGIVIGIGSVIAMVSVGTFVKEEALRQFTDMGTDVIRVRQDYGEGKGGGGVMSGPGGLHLSDIDKIPAECPEIGEIAPYIAVYGALRYHGRQMPAPALGVTSSFGRLFRLPVTEGRFVSDLDRYMSFCVVGPEVAAAMRQAGAKKLIGEKLTFKQRIFTVVGVTPKVPVGSMRPYEINDGIFIPITTASRFPDRPQIDDITARMVPRGRAAVAVAQLRSFFANNVPSFRPRVTSAEELIAKMEKQMQLFTLLLAAIGSISLIVGGVGVMNVMLVSVSERRKEIGIRRALGASKRDIQSQFLVESMILCFMGGIFGIGLGLGSSYLIAHFSKWTFSISYDAILIGFCVSAAVGVFFGFFPARQAARLNPIEALRSE